MRRSVTALVALAAICLLSVADVLAGGGMGAPPPDKTVGPTLNVSVVMDATPPPGSDPTYRQFSMTVQKGPHSHSALFTGTRVYLYGCLQSGFPDLQTSTEQRFLGSMNNWAPIEVLDALISPVGNSDLATIVDIDHVTCTTFGGQEYLSFTGKIRFAKF